MEEAKCPGTPCSGLPRHFLSVQGFFYLLPFCFLSPTRGAHMLFSTQGPPTRSHPAVCVCVCVCGYETEVRCLLEGMQWHVKASATSRRWNHTHFMLLFLFESLWARTAKERCVYMTSAGLDEANTDLLDETRECRTAAVPESDLLGASVRGNCEPRPLGQINRPIWSRSAEQSHTCALLTAW